MARLSLSDALAPGPAPAGSRLAHALCADRNAGALASSPLGITNPAPGLGSGKPGTP